MAKQTVIGAFAFPQDGKKIDPRKFEQMYEEAVFSTRSGSSFKTKKSFSPSTIGYGHGTCPRYWHIAFSGAEFADTFTSQGIVNMDSGTDSHARIQKYMSKMGILKDTEVEVVGSYPPVYGFADVLIEWEGEDVVGEIKTTSEEAFVWRQSSRKPSVSNLIQILIYLKALGLKEGFLFYENRNTNQILVIPVTLDKKNEEIVQVVRNWMIEVYDNWNSGGPLPKRVFQKRNKFCKGCPVFKKCWEELDVGEAEIKKLPLEELKP